MENILDSANVISLRRLGFYQIIKSNLSKRNLIFDEEKLLKILADQDNMLFLTYREKLVKRINPNISAEAISKANPTLLKNIFQKLES